MLRYIRAFFLALRMTARGETPPPHPYQPLLDWTRRIPELVADVYSQADRAGVNQAARAAIRLRLDGREMSMQTILAAVAFHGREEYPHLLRDITQHSVTAIYASNLNDRYYVEQLAASDDLPAGPLRDSVACLRDHLDAIPDSRTLDEPAHSTSAERG